MNSFTNQIAEIVEYYFQEYLSIGYKYDYNVDNFCKYVFTGIYNNRLLFNYEEFKNRFFQNGIPLDLIGFLITFWDQFENQPMVINNPNYFERRALYLDYANNFNNMNTGNIDEMYMKLICYIDNCFKIEMHNKDLNGELSQEEEEYTIKMIFDRNGCDDCCICFEESFTKTTCNHSICYSCSTDLYENTNGAPNCPLCRRQLELEIYNC